MRRLSGLSDAGAFLLAALALALAGAGCPSGPEPAPAPAPAPPPDPMAAVVSRLEEGARAGRAADPDEVLARLKAVAAQDPDPLLSALEGTGLVAGNRQWAASPEELAGAGEEPSEGGDLAIFQETVLDGGDGIYRLLHLLRLRSAGGFQADPKDVFSGEGRRKGDVVALRGRIVEAAFFRDRELFDLDRALARLASPDWRAGRAASDALLREGAGDALRRRAVRLLLRSAPRDARTLGLLELQGLAQPEMSAAEREGQEAGARIAAAYLEWFRDPAAGAWEPLFDAFLKSVSEPGRPAAERVERFAAGLAEFGHGSGLPRRVTEFDHPRSYVKALSPRLQDWFAGMLEGRHADAPAAAVAVAAGADPFLRAQFMERGRDAFLRAVVPGLALAPPWMALRAAAWIESATGAVLERFDPFAGAQARAAAARALAERFERTGFRERGGEAERTAKIQSARRALESLALMQRKVRAEKGRWAADLAEALRAGLGGLEAAQASGFLKDGAGRWSVRAGFSVDLALEGEGFRLLARGRVSEGEPEIVFRYDSSVGMAEILP